MLNSSLCDFTYVLKGTIKVVGKGVNATAIEADK